MLDFLFKKKNNEEKKDALLNEFYAKLKKKYNFDNISVKKKPNLKILLTNTVTLTTLI